MWGKTPIQQNQGNHMNSGYQEIRQSYQQQIQQSFRTQHGVQQHQQHQSSLFHTSSQSPAYAAMGQATPSYQISYGGDSFRLPTNHQVGGVPQSGHTSSLPQQSKGLWAQSRAEHGVSRSMSTSPWDPQGTSAFGAAFESFLNQKCSQNEKVVEVRGSQPAHYSPAPPSSEVPPSRRGRKPKPKVNNSMGSSVPAVPIPVEPVRGSGSIETVAEETVKVRRSTTHHHNQKSSSSVAPLASVDSSDFSNFFSPVKVSKEETLAESCEVTKRVNRYLQQVENQTPAPRVWSSLPGTSASLGTSVVEVKKKSNLELIKSETLFVPDQSHQCTLCAKTFASEARLVAHQVQQHFVILMISAFFFQL